MAQQAPRRSTRELRQIFGTLTDRAAGVIASHRACDCGAGAGAADGRDLNAMINDLMPIRHDGTKVDDDLSDEALNAMLARLEWRYSLLHQEVKAEPCVCGGTSKTPQTPETPETPKTDAPGSPPFRLEPTLMGLPLEIRSMIWGEALAPRDGIVRIMPRTLFPGQYGRAGGAWYPPERFSVPGRVVVPPGTSQAVPQRQTWRRRTEMHQAPLVHYWYNPSVNDYNLLLVSRQIHEEAEREFWRRAVTDRLMFSFGPRDRDALAIFEEYNGILSAYTFFMTFLREEPQYLPSWPGADYLRLIRRVHLDLTDSPWGGRRQALAGNRLFGQTNAIQYLDDLLDLIHQNLTGLEHLSLAFNGWVPDFRYTPWREGPPQAPPFAQGVPPAPQDSTHWVSRLFNFSTRPVARLRVRLVLNLPFGTIIPPNWVGNPHVLRAARFITRVRRHMLINGAALGGREWRARNEPDGHQWPQPRFIVECDDEWDANTNTHIQHVGEEREETEYDPR